MKLLKNQTDFFFMSGHIKVDILCSFSGSFFFTLDNGAAVFNAFLHA